MTAEVKEEVIYSACASLIIGFAFWLTVGLPIWLLLIGVVGASVCPILEHWLAPAPYIFSRSV